MTLLKQDNDKVNVSGYNDHCVMSVHDLDDTVTRIKPGKHDDYLGLSSDHVKHACPEFYVHLSMLFTYLYDAQ